MRCALLGLIALLVSAPLADAQGPVLVVDDVVGPGVDFIDLQLAVDIASDGDTILVKDGTYARTTIAGKGLTLVADAGAQVNVNGLIVKWLGAAQSVTVRGLSIASDQGVGLTLFEDDGPIWIEGCAIQGRNGFYGTSPAAPGASIDHCASATLLNCGIHGGFGANGSPNGGSGSPGAPGLVVKGASQVVLYETSLAGGTGGHAYDGNEWFATGGAGGAGAEVDGSLVFASGCLFVGSDGGWGGCGKSVLCGPGGLGGNGLTVVYNGVATLLGCATIGGKGGEHGSGTSYANDGKPTFAEAGGSIGNLPGPARSMVATSPVREGQATTLDFRGVPGDTAFVIYSTAHQAALDIPLFSGFLLPSFAGLDAVGFGVLAGDTLSVPIVVPVLPPTIDGTTYYLQSFFAGPGGSGFFLGSASALTVLDSTL